jgi:hypothetical protein
MIKSGRSFLAEREMPLHTGTQTRTLFAFASNINTQIVIRDSLKSLPEKGQIRFPGEIAPF